MSWRIDELLLLATPKALKRIKSDIQLQKFAYFIPHIDDYDWCHPEHRHNLPPEGLIIIRPVCSGESADKYHHTFLNSDGMNTIELNTSFLAETKGKIVPEAPKIKQSFREFLVHFSRRIETPVLYYSMSTWGGTFDYELSFLYQPEETFYSSPTHFEPVVSDKQENALIEGLAGIGITTFGYFAPHSSEFEWNRYKLVN
ncbi:hypothetical protein FE394_04600 [Xenorhabdus sp. Reich]|uniref:Uncharacterized protein n=1 Tax=Xenorhabdus littoralis TaxID=2582835 RepID=A0ABU4SIL1_9GAMM|nr:hypothetical protein [Xenorhabdus sp. Reich]MDX7998492.1 hypothetical protein [Xenorhabdus sp. Reich]